MRSVLIADSNTRLSRLVGQLLADEPGFRVLGVHHTEEEALRTAQELRPDVVLLSERLEGRPTDDLCALLRDAAPDAALVMWSHDPTSRDRGESVADAVVERGTTFRHFVRDLRAVARHGEQAQVGWGQPATEAGPSPRPRPARTPGLVDDPDGSGALLLSCEACCVRVRVATADIAPAVDEARAFFLAHDACDTQIDLMNGLVTSSAS